jgi:death-on-curing protein
VSDLYWFGRHEALAAHELMLSRYGGSRGVRDNSMLESALSKPRPLQNYASPNLPELAAAYAAGIVRNYPFVDGNKRTGFMLGVAFLERNGSIFSGTEAEAVLNTLALAAGELGDAGFATWLATNSSPAS